MATLDFLFALSTVALLGLTLLSVAYAKNEWCATTAAAIGSCNCTELVTGNRLAGRQNGASCSGPTLNVSAVLPLLTAPQSNVDVIRLNNASIDRLVSNLFSASSKLTLLNLAANGIRSVDVGAFRALSFLETLSLENNRIRLLDPGTFSGLERLAVLSIAGNELYAVDNGLFSPSDVPSLTVLDLRRCRISDFRLADDLQRLQTVNLADNRLDSFPVFGNGLSSLIEIDLSRNRIHSLDGDTWLPLPGPKTLHLEGNRIEVLSNGSIFASAPPATEQYRLVKISLANNRIRVIERGSLMGVEHLEVLDLSFNQLSTVDAESLPWQSLQKVIVHDNPWDCGSSNGCLNGWMVNHQSVVEDWNKDKDLLCASPQELIGRHIYANRVMEQCKNSTAAAGSSSSSGGGRHTGLYISIAVLIVTLSFAVAVFVLVRRRRRHDPRPIFIDPLASPSSSSSSSSSRRKGFGMLSSVIGRRFIAAAFPGSSTSSSSSPMRRSAREADDSWSSSRVSYRQMGQMDDLVSPSSSQHQLDDHNELDI